MKALAPLLLLSACPSHAALLAHVSTTRGTVTVELQHGTAPQAVANFMTLAQGKRTRIDPNTGAATDAPLYIGEKFFRTANNTSVKFAQTGSGTGSNNGSSGFTFKDEFSPSARHTGYTLSSANAGPNTNNGQIFFTGNVAIPSYDDVHSIVGLIPAPSSRGIIDAIIAAGDNATTITGINFERTDAAAVAFDEMAQGLPEVEKADGRLAISPGVSSVWQFDSPITTGSIFRAFQNTSLTGTWTKLDDAELQLGILPHPQVASASHATLGTALPPSCFYHLTVTRHPGAVGPTTLASRTVMFPISNGVFSYEFDGTGTGGTLTFTPTTGSVIISPFSTINPGNGSAMAPYSGGVHNINFVADGPGLNPRYVWVKLGCDSATETTIAAHHISQRYNGLNWVSFVSGPATITR